jgi:hypothetical protein
MSLLSALTGRDRPGEGRHYADRMRAILGACSAMRLYTIDPDRKRRIPLVTAARGIDIEAPEVGFVERYPLQVSPDKLATVLGMARQFAYALNVDVERVSVAQEGNVVWVGVTLEHPRTLTFERAWSLKPGIPQGHVLLGITPSGDQLTLDLVADRHCALVGMTGSGKSTLAQTMILSAELIGGAEVALFDPRGQFAPLSGHPAVWRGGRFEDPREIEACLAHLSDVARHNDNARRLYVFVDEVRQLIGERPRIYDHLDSLASTGRHAGIHLVLCSQQATGRPGMLLQNMPARIVGMMGDAMKAAAAAGHGKTGAERLPLPGHFIITRPAEMRFQAPMPSAAEIARLCPYPPAVGVVPQDHVPPAAQFTPDAREASKTITATSQNGDPGRKRNPLRESVRRKIAKYHAEHHERPPRRTVAVWAGVRVLKRRTDGTEYWEGDIDNDEWKRWDEEALG